MDFLYLKKLASAFGIPPLGIGRTFFGLQLAFAFVTFTACTPGLDGDSQNKIEALRSALLEEERLRVLRENEFTGPTSNNFTLSFTETSQITVEMDTSLEVGIAIAGDLVEDEEIDFVVSGSASEGGDYDALARSLTLRAGTTAASIAISVLADSLPEADETLSIAIRENGGTGEWISHTITITNDDTFPVIQFSQASQSVAENAALPSVEISLSQASGAPAQIEYTVTGTSTYFVDHQVDHGVIQVPVGSTSIELPLELTDDSEHEPSETLILTLSNPTYATLGAQAVHTLTITDNEAQPTVSLVTSHSGAVENQSQALVAVLDYPTYVDVQVPFTVLGTSTATLVNDHDLTDGTITIPAGTTVATRLISVVDDSINELTETINVRMGVPTNASVGTQVANFNIVDNDPVSVSFSTGATTVSESIGAINLPVSIDRNPAAAVIVPFSITNESTVDNDDHTLIAGALVFSPGGSLSQNISFNIVNDGLQENDEYLRLVIGNFTNAIAGSVTNHSVRILNDDEYDVSFTSSSASVLEGDGTYTITAQLSVNAPQVLTVPVDITGSATSGDDYTLSSNDLVFLAGSNTATIDVTLNEDALIEGRELINFAMDTTYAHATFVSPSSFELEIRDNDPSPVAIHGGGYNFCADMGGAIQCWGSNSFGQLGTNNTRHSASPTLPVVGDLSEPIIVNNNLPANDLITDLDIGQSTICVVRQGLLYCAGNNEAAQTTGYSDNDFERSQYFYEVNKAGSGITNVAVGEATTCFVQSGGVKCYGGNTFGQIGTGGAGGIDDTFSTYAISTGSGVTEVSAAESGHHFCALRSGDIWCWGRNTNGQLGDGTTSSYRASPVAVIGEGVGPGISSLSLGGNFTCFVKSGAVYCMGANAVGQLGDGTTTERSSPVMATGLGSGMLKIASNRLASCAINSSGEVYCWGQLSHGMPGDGTTNATRTTPQIVPGLSNTTDIAASRNGFCAIESGEVVCWGSGAFGSTGTLSAMYSATPVTPFNLNINIQAGAISREGLACVIQAGVVKCWGSIFNLPTNTTNDPTILHEVTGWDDSLDPVESISLQSQFGCVVRDGDVECMGTNFGSLLPLDPSQSFTVPTVPQDLDTDVTRVHLATGRGYAVKSGGLYVWGEHSRGAVGLGNVQGTPLSVQQTATPIAALSTGVSQVISGYRHTCVIANGALFCMGGNTYGHLGNGSTGDSFTPTAALLTGGVTKASAGRDHTCAIVDGGLKCWGWSVYGVLGSDQSNLYFASPQDVPGVPAGSGLTDLMSGEHHNCYIQDAQVYCFGLNDMGQLGDPSFTDTISYTPRLVSGFEEGRDEAVQFFEHDLGHTTCVIINAGTGVKCWGADYGGMLGQGEDTYIKTPTAINDWATP